MFGRLSKITLISSQSNKESLVVVDTQKNETNSYLFNAVIERFPYDEVDCLTLTIYNLEPRIRGELAVKTYDRVSLEFGYKDEGGMLSTIFEGNIVRPLYTRIDAVTDATILYVWDSGDFKNYGFVSLTYDAGVNYYQIAQDIATKGTYKMSNELTEKLKQYKTTSAKSIYGTQDDALQNIAKECGLPYKTENNVVKIFGDKIENEEVIVFTRTLEDGRIVSQSGLIGIPSLSNDGLYFSCLVNPKLSIFSVVKIDNSVINIEQSGAVPNVETGGQLNSDGLYRVVKLTTTISNDGNQNQTSVKAISLNLFNTGEY